MVGRGRRLGWRAGGLGSETSGDARGTREVDGTACRTRLQDGDGRRSPPPGTRPPVPIGLGRSRPRLLSRSPAHRPQTLALDAGGV